MQFQRNAGHPRPANLGEGTMQEVSDNGIDFWLDAAADEASANHPENAFQTLDLLSPLMGLPPLDWAEFERTLRDIVA